MATQQEACNAEAALRSEPVLAPAPAEDTLWILQQCFLWGSRGRCRSWNE